MVAFPTESQSVRHRSDVPVRNSKRVPPKIHMSETVRVRVALAFCALLLFHSAAELAGSNPMCVRMLPKRCEPAGLRGLRQAAGRGPLAPGIAEDQFRLAEAIEHAARECPGGTDGLLEAQDWYETAGAKGHAEAAYRAALFHLNGPEPQSALAFLYIAAEKGHAAAQARLALCHLRGVGVERNLAYGAQLLVRAALLKLGV